MENAFVHYEILGPRASVEHWLGTVQDLGSCHVADAMRDLEGETGIGRPAPTLEEWEAELVRSEAALALRAVARVLPPTRLNLAAGDRPVWTLEPGGVGERQLLALRDEAVAIASRIRDRLESVRASEERADAIDALQAGVRALDKAKIDVVQGRVLALPRGAPNARRLRRRLRREGLRVLRADGVRTRVLVLPDVAEATTADSIAAMAGAHSLEFPAALRGTPPAAAAAHLVGERASADRSESEARAALRARLAEDGARGRLLLDALEDSEKRREARRLLASSQHVVALRVYVRREDDADLRDSLTRTWGDTLVIRPLADAADAPTLPRSVAPVPFAALGGLAPRRFGETPLPSVLALFAPLAAGAVLADVAGGLLLLVTGALLGLGSGRGSPRRDTALLSEAAGLIALAFGLMAGRALGGLGETLFGTGWGLAPGVSFAGGGSAAGAFLGILYVLGQVSAVIALWGLAISAFHWRQSRIARARASLVATLDYVCVAGIACAAAPATHPLAMFWFLVPVALVLRVVLGGIPSLVSGLVLDLVGVLRAVAVAGAAVLLFLYGFGRFVEPSLSGTVIGTVALIVAAFALVVDAAHLAMGVPYDLSLGGRRISRPFTPLARRTRSASDL